MKQRAAFSLVELSIVLVILGLLTGGILAGQSLIRAASIRALTTDFNKYRTATYTFRDKYFGLPGDFTKATDLWGIAGGSTGSDAACAVVDASTLSDPRRTCNGDGNGYLNFSPGANGTQYWSYGERFRYWQQLANAGLIEGAYSGVTASTTFTYAQIAGKTSPPSKFSNVVYGVGSLDSESATASPVFFDGPRDMNVLQISTPSLTAVTVDTDLHPEEAWNIDTKIDDGKPATGTVQSAKRSSPYAPNCTTSDLVTAEYDLPASSVRCYIHNKI